MADVKDEALVSLDDGDYEVAEGETDVRGWSVITADQHKIGEVEDLLADPSALKVRYLTVELDRNAAGPQHADRTIRVPIARARLHEEDNQVVLDMAAEHLENMAAAPAVPRGDEEVKLTRAAEELRIRSHQKNTLR